MSLDVNSEEVPTRESVRLFERPVLPGWVYPCTLDDIHAQLARVPAADLVSLSAVGLVPATRKDCDAYAYHRWDGLSVIHICSQPEGLSWKLYPHAKRGHIEHCFAVELSFGMQVERTGSRWRVHWQAEDLRRYTPEHVLLHEIGHHVQKMQRLREGLRSRLPVAAKEQFAEAYAGRLRRSLRQSE
jgi:hypothetical protein